MKGFTLNRKIFLAINVALNLCCRKNLKSMNRRREAFCLHKCDHEFMMQNKLKQHERIQTEEKFFAKCNKEFVWSSDLKNHESIHTGGKPFVCTQCGKAFKTSGNLMKHERIDTREEPFFC